MTDKAAGASPALSEGLGPLPEPDVWRARGTLWSLGTLMKLRLQGEASGLFTAEQMRAYAALERAAERERCALIVEDMVRAVDGADALAAIRGA